MAQKLKDLASSVIYYIKWGIYYLTLIAVILMTAYVFDNYIVWRVI